MNKILLSILMCSSFVLAKEHTTYTHAYVIHSKPVYEYKNNQRHNNSYENNHYRSNYSNNYSNNNTRYQNNAYAKNTGYSRNYSDNRYEKHHKRRKQKILVGYENYFVYKNREFHKFSNHKKDRIRITETINF